MDATNKPDRMDATNKLLDNLAISGGGKGQVVLNYL